MKRLLFILLFSISYIYVYGYYEYAANNSFNSVNCYHLSNTSNQQSSGRIGYTTNYSNGQYNSNIYKHITINNYTCIPSIPEYNAETSYHPGGIRRSAQRPFSGNFFEDLMDWLRIETDGDWPSYIDDDFWEEFLADYPEYENEARNWYENRGQKFPGDPDDPFLEPVGEFPMLLLLFLLFIYIYYRKTRVIDAKI